jgi:hypothetical protein
MSELLLDRAGRRRSPARMPGFHAGRPPRNKGLRYPADPPKVEEIIAVMRAASEDAHGRRLRRLIVILWRAGLRIEEALALAEGDLDQRRGALSSSAARAGGAARSAWMLGAGRSRSPGSSCGSSCLLGRCSVSSRGRPAAGRGRAPPPEQSWRQDRRPGRRPAALCAPPAPTHPCRRARTRGRATDRDPTPTGLQQRRHHVRLPAGHRQRQIIETVHARRQPMIPVRTSVPH